jgi:hypothetical protein
MAAGRVQSGEDPAVFPKLLTFYHGLSISMNALRVFPLIRRSDVPFTSFRMAMEFTPTRSIGFGSIENSCTDRKNHRGFEAGCMGYSYETALDQANGPTHAITRMQRRQEKSLNSVATLSAHIPS